MTITSCKEKKEQKEQEKVVEKIENFKIEFGKVSKKSIFKEESKSVWGGGTLTKGEDGLYHMFYSRWPKNIGWEWVNYSEIAHATATSHLDHSLFKRCHWVIGGEKNIGTELQHTTLPSLKLKASTIYIIWVTLEIKKL